MKKDTNERMMTSPQKLAQMQHYWDKLWHLTPDKDKVVGFLTSNKSHLRNVFDMQTLLVDAKDVVIRKLEQAKGAMDTFIRTENGYRVTAPEGFVAIDQTGNAVKLVDRLEFSRANFNAAKDWTK